MTTQRVNATDSAIKRFAKDKSITEINDPRFKVIFRYHKNRAKGSWHWRHQGKWKKVGEYPQMTIKDIESNNAFIEINLACGMSIEDAAIPHWNTVGDLLGWYLIRIQKTVDLSDHRKSTIKSAINKHLKPALGLVPVESITKRDVDELLLTLQQTLSKSFINLVFGVLKTAYTIAYDQDRISTNPVARFLLKDFGSYKPDPKPCMIEWYAVPAVIDRALASSPQSKLLAMMMIMHGTRIGETRQARWRDIDFEKREWHIPEKVTKTKQAITIPLTDLSITLLMQYKENQRHRYSGDFIFQKTARKPITGTQANDLIKEASQGEWTAHDLRKVFRTSLTKLGVDFWVGELLLNHKLSDMAVTYIHDIGEDLKMKATMSHHQWLKTLSEALRQCDND